MAKSSSIPAAAESSGNSFTAIFTRFTWYELLAIPVVAVGVAVYWFRAEIAASFNAAHEATALMLGAGVAPLLLWMCAALGTLFFKPAWFVRHYKLWLASVPLLALTFGVLSFFRPLDGALAWFTLQGYVSMGGMVGETIAGDTLPQQVLRLGGLAFIAVALLSPVFIGIFAMTLGRLLLYAYIGLVLVFQAIGGVFKRKPKEAPTLDDTETQPSAMHNSVYSEHAFGRLATESAAGGAYESGGVATLPPKNDDPDYDADDDAPPYAAETNGYHIEDVASVEAVSEEYAEHAVAEETPHTNGVAQAVDYELTDMTDSAAELAPVADLTDDTPQPQDDDGYDDYDAQDDDALAVGMSITDTNLAAAAAPVGAAVDSDSKPSGLKTMLGKRGEKWAKPSIEMLQGVEDRGIPEEQINETAEIIRQTLADHGVEVQIGNIKYGPTVTMYGLIPGWTRRYKQVRLEDDEGNPILDERGKQITTRQQQKTRVKVGAILSQEKDLSLALRTPSLRIETPVMGKAQVGIEIPNEQPAPVTLRSIMETGEYKKVRSKSDLPVALGKGTGGENIALDLSKMPHLLIAGATGSGKSVALNAIVAGLLMERSPAELRMLLIDPKRVELTPYNGVPHLLCPVIVEVDEVVGMLKGVINEMMNRYRQMEDIGVRNIEAYNERNPDEPMPFLLVVVDELADLMMTAAADVEQSLCRLAQLGRATGIHLILATQRPSVDVVTGLIKANFPSRISFGVTSHTDSRTILDVNGAEKLLGKGDMLYLPRDAARPLRAQGAFISDEELDNIINFWQNTPRAWMQDVSLSAVSEDDGGEEDEDASNSTDALFDKAVELARTQRKLSTSLLQRRLRVGYPRAARLMDELEENGIVGPSDGSRSRDVL